MIECNHRGGNVRTIPSPSTSRNPFVTETVILTGGRERCLWHVPLPVKRGKYRPDLYPRGPKKRGKGEEGEPKDLSLGGGRKGTQACRSQDKGGRIPSKVWGGRKEVISIHLSARKKEGG